MDKVLVFIIIVLLIAYFLKLNENSLLKDDVEFYKWQSEQFADKLKQNKIEFEWG